jgi:hypothetical protein
MCTVAVSVRFVGAPPKALRTDPVEVMVQFDVAESSQPDIVAVFVALPS